MLDSKAVDGFSIQEIKGMQIEIPNWVGEGFLLTQNF